MFKHIRVRVSELKIEEETTYDEQYKATKQEVVKVTLLRDGKGPHAFVVLSVPTSEPTPFVLGARLVLVFEPAPISVMPALPDDVEPVPALHGMGGVEVTQDPGLPAKASAGEREF